MADKKTGRKRMPADQLFLERPRIDKLLETALQSPVIIVTAGAGYGKTHAVNSFLQNYDAVTIRLQLFERDNLESRFWENYSSAVSAVNKSFGTYLAGMGFPETTRQFDQYISLLEKEISTYNKNYIVVLDDFQHIKTRTVLDVIEKGLSVPIPNNKLIVISRSEPAINTMALLSKGFLARIGVDDLRFSEKESADYFQLENISLEPEEISRIYRSTDGWALALSLLARELKIRSPGNHTRSILEMGSLRTVMEELLGEISPELRKFLIKLSLIERWSVDLLEKLNPEKKLIEEMNSLSSFIHYDAYLNGFLIHRLLVDFLKEKQTELSREEIREVYAVTARWCLDNKLLLDAAAAYEGAKDFTGINDIIYSFPRIVPPRTAVFLLEISDRMLSAENNENEDVLFLRFVGRNKLLVSLGRFDEAAASCREGAEKFEKEPGPFSSYMLTFIYNRLGIISLLTCIHTKAFDYLPYFKKASDYYNENPVPVRGPITHTNVTAYVCQISYPAEKGQYERSISAIREAIPYTDNSLSGLLYGVDDLAQAEFDYFRGNLSGAEQYARQAVLKAREKQQYEIESRGLFFLLRIALNAGNSKDVQDILGQLNAQLETEEYLNRFTLYDIITGWFYAQIGLPSRVAPWLRDDAGGDDEAKNFLYDLETLVKAKCFFVEKRYAESSKVLKHWIPQTPPGFLLGRLEMTLLEALNCHYLEAGPEKAAGAFRTAYVISASNSFDMPFIELGEDMRLLSRDGKNSGIPPAWLEAVQNKASAYGKKILMAAGEFLETERNGKTAPYLTRREREVLGGLSQGLTREEIAEGSSISLNTVKSVIRSVYNKLGAINRADAVRIATSMGLLKTGH